MIAKRGQLVHLLERMLGLTPPKVVVTSLARSTLILKKYSYIYFWLGYGHQMSAAGTPLGEESSGHLLLGISDVKTCSHVIDKYR